MIARYIDTKQSYMPMDKLYTQKKRNCLRQYAGRGNSINIPKPKKESLMFIKQFARTYNPGNPVC